MEIWKQITMDDKLVNYEVSNTGLVRHIKFKRLLKFRINKHSYLELKIRKGKEKGKLFQVHRIVALTFIDNPELKPLVNHKNGVRHDNRLENLEWVTNKENIIHGYQRRDKTHNTLIINKLKEIYESKKWETAEEFYQYLIYPRSLSGQATHF